MTYSKIHGRVLFHKVLKRRAQPEDSPPEKGYVRRWPVVCVEHAIRLIAHEYREKVAKVSEGASQ